MARRRVRPAIAVTSCGCRCRGPSGPGARSGCSGGRRPENPGGVAHGEVALDYTVRRRLGSEVLVIGDLPPCRRECPPASAARERRRTAHEPNRYGRWAVARTREAGLATGSRYETATSPRGTAAAGPESDLAHPTPSEADQGRLCVGEVATRHARWPAGLTGRTAGKPSDLNSLDDCPVMISAGHEPRFHPARHAVSAEHGRLLMDGGRWRRTRRLSPWR